MRWLTIISFAFIFIFIQPVSAALKKCVDDKGRTQYYNNTPPPECLGKATVEMSDHGVVIKKTKEEVELKEAEEQAKREAVEKKRAVDKKRLDAALLATYTDKKEIDLARDRNIQPAELAIKGIEPRLKVSQDRLEVLKLQFLEAQKTKSPALASLKKEMNSAKKEVVRLEDELIKRKEEVENIKARFSAERKRFIELKQGKP
jgi:predicted  nucleic acid-binding Zn-ribbon protein